MHARTGILEVSSDRLDDAVDQFRDEQIPRYRDQNGYKGFTMLADREGGKLIGVSFWDSEQSMRASDDLGREAREQITATGGGPEATVDHWEVVIDETA